LIKYGIILPNTAVDHSFGIYLYLNTEEDYKYKLLNNSGIATTDVVDH